MFVMYKEIMHSVVYHSLSLAYSDVASREVLQ